jgi:hypothetical protein
VKTRENFQSVWMKQFLWLECGTNSELPRCNMCTSVYQITKKSDIFSLFHLR